MTAPAKPLWLQKFVIELQAMPKPIRTAEQKAMAKAEGEQAARMAKQAQCVVVSLKQPTVKNQRKRAAPIDIPPASTHVVTPTKASTIRVDPAAKKTKHVDTSLGNLKRTIEIFKLTTCSACGFVAHGGTVARRSQMVIQHAQLIQCPGSTSMAAPTGIIWF